MTRIEIKMEAVSMNAEEAQAIKDRINRYRRRQSEAAIAMASSHQRNLKNIADHSTNHSHYHGNLVPVDELPPSSLMPQTVCYKGSQKPTSQRKETKSPEKKSSMMRDECDSPNKETPNMETAMETPNAETLLF